MTVTESPYIRAMEQRIGMTLTCCPTNPENILSNLLISRKCLYTRIYSNLGFQPLAVDSLPNCYHQSGRAFSYYHMPA